MQTIIKDENMDMLFDAMLKLKDIDECYAFLEDLCTVAELLAMKQRFWVARLLKEGYIYTDIVQMTGASTATISRVNRCLNYGKGGYVTALERTSKQ